MNKRGVELTLNTVIIGILVVLVLIVIITFFLGGTAGLTRTIRGIFYGTTAGTSEALAVQTCNNRCDQASILPIPTARAASAFCKQSFEIDKDNDGEADYTLVDKKKVYDKYYCWPGTDKAEEGKAREFYLNVPCDFECGGDSAGMTDAEKQAAKEAKAAAEAKKAQEAASAQQQTL